MALSPASSEPMEYREPMEYTKPMIVDYGDLAELTAGTQGGNVLDATFPAGTSRGDLTFSHP
jgi:hypothetical protein